MSARTSTRSVHAEEWRALVRSALIAVGTAHDDGGTGPGNGVYCWGDNRNSQLGISGYDSTGAPRWVFGERAPYDLRRERVEVYP